MESQKYLKPYPPISDSFINQLDHKVEIYLTLREPQNVSSALNLHTMITAVFNINLEHRNIFIRCRVNRGVSFLFCIIFRKNVNL